MILKSACSHNASYIDRLISVFMRSLQKMVREHLSPQQANPGVTETSTGTFMIERHQTRRHQETLKFVFYLIQISIFYSVCKKLLEQENS